MFEYKNILVVTAHPDDMEIACSGTLRRFQENGACIHSVVTVRPSAEVNNQRNQTIVEQELFQSYRQSKFKLKVFDTELHNNGRPNLICNNNTITRLGELLVAADLVIIPNPEDSHQDHRTTYELMLPFLKNYNEVWAMHLWPYEQHYKTKANLHIAIDQQWEFKKSLLECYQSYIYKGLIKKIETSNRYHGLHTNSNLAESFTMVNRCVY